MLPIFIVSPYFFRFLTTNVEYVEDDTGRLTFICSDENVNTLILDISLYSHCIFLAINIILNVVLIYTLKVSLKPNSKGIKIHKTDVNMTKFCIVQLITLTSNVIVEVTMTLAFSFENPSLANDALSVIVLCQSMIVFFPLYGLLYLSTSLRKQFYQSIGLGKYVNKIGTTIKSHVNEGVVLDIIGSSSYHLTRNVAHNEGHQYMSFNRMPAYFNIHLCDFGLFIRDYLRTADELNNEVERIHYVDYIVIFVLKTTRNQIIWNTFEYNGVNVFVSVCPYIRWASRNGIIKLIPECHIKHNGLTTPLNNEAHIIVPIYLRKNDLNFFICAKVKQPSLPDLSLGYYIMPGGIEMSYEEDVNGLFNELTCKNKQDPSKLYHFGHISRYSNYLEKDIWEKITANSLKGYNFYLDEVIFINQTKTYHLKTKNIFQKYINIECLKSHMQV
uniref:Serpentine receptor class gamma n=1 Tax=Parastrongyloides trichosuri TaxID=131310 RepID=A0A0N4Z1F6_PARTI